MRRAIVSILVLLLVAGFIAAQSSAPQQPPPANPPAPQNPPQARLPDGGQAPARPALSVVVLDPSHGGSDAGARGPSGVTESDVVMTFARAVRTELERQGFRVVQTRQGNENPSFDDRAAAANSQRNAVFISLHVASSGPPGGARVYFYAGFPAAPEASPAGLVPWDQAQQPHLDRSRRLAELVAAQLGQRLRNSPQQPAPAAVRQLRTIAAPAIAIEVASVAVDSRNQLEQYAPALAEGVTRGVAAFRAELEAGAK